MNSSKRDFLTRLTSQGAVVTSLIWLVTIGVAAPQVWPLIDGAPWLRTLTLACLGLPAIITSLLASRLDRSSAQFVLALVWTALAATVAMAGGGVTGLAALAFLIGPAVAASSGERRGITRAIAISAGAGAIVAGLQIAGFVQPAPMAVEQHLPFVFGTAVLLATGFGLGALQAVRTADRIRAEADRGRIRSRAFDAAPAALVACDADGHILAASNGLRDLSPGLPRDLYGLPLADLGFDDEDRAQLAASGRRAALRDISADLTLRGPDRGARSDITFKARPIHGGSVAILAADPGHDLERRLAEAESMRRQAEDDALAKSQFLASVSHELRTPLNAIIGFSDVMKARLFGPMPARYAEYADLIHESGQHLMELIGDVLDMSKIEADRYELVREEFEIGEVIGLAAKMMRLQAEEAGLTLTVRTPDEPVRVTADRKALRQILLNLLSNAVKFTPEGGAVVVMAKPSGQNLVIAVGDSGVGIDAGEASQLGQPYQQATNARDIDKRGTGLGLSLVRSLAELHGGAMALTSRKGVGTTVTVTLPVLVEDRGEVETLPATGLDVHQQIERARAASENMTPAKSA
ncbi:sensor histidine kinase [Maricaulis sp. CAU 1757]